MFYPEPYCNMVKSAPTVVQDHLTTPHFTSPQLTTPHHTSPHLTPQEKLGVEMTALQCEVCEEVLPNPLAYCMHKVGLSHTHIINNVNKNKINSLNIPTLGKGGCRPMWIIIN